VLTEEKVTSLADKVTTSRAWRSFFRHGPPDTSRNRALAVFSNVFLHLHPVRIPRQTLQITYTFCLGGISFFLFLMLTLTGVLLMFYYIPSVTTAYQNVKDLETTVAFGMLLRNLHRWTAHGMVITVFLHMMRVFYTGAYKPPREFNWIIGVVLLVLTFLLSFTGYLLPWDQLAIWAVTVGTNMVGATPVLGSQIHFLLIGGFDVGQNGLLRFYVLHVIGLPLLAAIFMAVHFWRIRKDGGLTSPL
jgi:cytochrome b6